jgi:hypothetical protein
MAFLGNLVNAAGAALYAFKESMLNADPQGRKASLDYGVWDRWEARLTRYDLLWSLYQNNAYQDLVHPWAPRFKTAFALYKHCRHLYNPAYRLGEFWSGHLFAGSLDKDAGDGEKTPSALPILTDNEAIRKPIGKLWRDSKWQIHKDRFTRNGAVLGDFAAKVCDDTKKGRVCLEIVHPGHLKWVDFDEQKNVKSYVIQKWMFDPRDRSIADVSPVIDPRARQRVVIYQEKAFRDGNDVVYQTFLDGKPYAWDDAEEAEWREPYGFIPLVVGSHEHIGLDWGACAFHSGLSRFREVDDQASGLSDQNRKAQRAPMLLAGVDAPKGGLLKSAQTDRSQQTPEANANNPEPSRTQSDYLYTSNSDARAQHLTFNLDIMGALAHIASLNQDIEKNYPELLADTGMSGTITAEAIRQNRQLAAGKVQGKRPNYDDPMVRLHQMAISIGGYRGYEGYQGFDLESYGAGKLDHQIGHRPVFEVDPLDSIEEDQAFWTAIQAQVKAGVPLRYALERSGWTEDDLGALDKAKTADDARAVDMAKQQAVAVAGVGVGVGVGGKEPNPKEAVA